MTSLTETTNATEGQESLGGVLGMGVGFLFLLACVLAVFFYGPRSLAAGELLAESFKVDGSLSGLTLDPEALVLPKGERVFTFSDGGELRVGVQEIVVEDSKEGGRGRGSDSKDDGDDFEPFDWSALEVKVANGPPARFYLVNFTGDRAESVLLGAFSGLEWKELSELGAKGGSAVVGGGKLEWAGYDADWVRERRFLAPAPEDGTSRGTFRDTLRVNLSLGRECWIGYAIWREGEEGGEQRVSELLDGLLPLYAER